MSEVVNGGRSGKAARAGALAPRRAKCQRAYRIWALGGRVITDGVSVRSRAAIWILDSGLDAVALN